LASYFDDLLNTLTNVSLHLTPAMKTEFQNHFPDPVKTPKKFKSVLAHLIKLFRYVNKTDVQVGQQITADDFFYGQAKSRPLLAHGKAIFKN
jgi:hypothetical protein